jgi:opacity protein-like surface antigen
MKRLVALMALVLGSAAYAAESDRAFTFVAGLGVTGGGSTLATVHSQNINGGSGLMLYFGGETRIGTLVSLQATFGYHVDTTRPSDGEVTFSRYPIDLIAYVPASDKLRFGLGAQFINNPTLKGTGVASNVDAKFDSTVGVVLEGEYRFTPWIGVKLRGVSATFKATATGESASGDHIGVLCNFYF